MTLPEQMFPQVFESMNQLLYVFHSVERLTRCPAAQVVCLRQFSQAAGQEGEAAGVSLTDSAVKASLPSGF